MQILVTSFTGKTLSLFLPAGPSSTTLHVLKQAIQDREGVPVRAQKLFLGTKILSIDSRSLADYGVPAGSTLSLLLPVLGGMPASATLPFLHSHPPPPNYVAGLGRGAAGFTTRSDIGPARTAAPELYLHHYPSVGGVVAGPAGRGRGELEAGAAEEDHEDLIDADDDKGLYSANQSKFDEFEGDDVGLLANADGELYEEDDKEADAVWESIDKRMDSRRKGRRQERLKEEIEKYRASNPTIAEEFAGLKRKLMALTPEEWDAIPEVGDHSLRHKKRKFNSFVPPPDSLLEKAKREQELVTAVDPRSCRAAAADGADTPLSQTETVPVSDLTAVGEGRGTVLKAKLDKLSDSVTGLTVVDPIGYLTDLKSIKITSDGVISDIRKARLLLKSVIQTNPKHAPGWIAAARLEEVAGKLQAARNFIQRGYEECPKKEDVWLEACRLALPANAKAILVKGIKAIPNSVKLWMQAAMLEHDDANKSRVLRKALEHIPDSAKLWKAVVELAANEEDARILLQRATECCPLHVELWLALARLETYERAKNVLNRAREALPTDLSIWITAAKLEEAHGDTTTVPKVIARAIMSLQSQGVFVDREAWIKEAEAAERAGSVATCQAIIRETIRIGVEEDDRKRTWVADAEECEKRGSIETARAIYAHALSVFKGKKSVWLRAAQLEKSHGTRDSLDSLLRTAVTYCPQAEVLWLMGAKEKWLAGEVPAARIILQEAYAAIPKSEAIWLAAFKLEFENQEPQRAKLLLSKARERGGSTGRVWMKSAIVERELGNVVQEKQLLEEGLSQFPGFFKLWLMLGQLEDREGHPEAAREIFQRGLKHCPHSIPLWLCAAQLEEKIGGLSRARAVLTTARLKNPQNPELWLAAIRAEARGGYKKEAESLIAKALKECPTSGRLWATAIEMAPRHQRKTKSLDAFKSCGHDSYVVASVAKLFWHGRKVDEARTWLERTVTLAPDIGDFWALWYKFELEQGTETQQQEVLRRCIAAEPRHGELWIAVSKALENSHLPVEGLLKKVVVALGGKEESGQCSRQCMK